MSIECPDCGGQMVLRTNRKTNEKFWGCCDYPECTGTRLADAATTVDEAGDLDGMPSDRLRRNDSHRWRNG